MKYFFSINNGKKVEKKFFFNFTLDKSKKGYIISIRVTQSSLIYTLKEFFLMVNS